MYFLILGIMGLVIGSFIGALTYRLPRGIGINSGRSVCDDCKKKISWFDNIPLLSYLILRGKCRNCSEKVSWRYPVIEAVTAVLFVVVGLSLTKLFLVSILIAIFVVDFENQLISDELVYILLLFSVIYSTFSGLNPFLGLLYGFGASVFLLSLNFITRGKGMGLGDVKLAVPLGLFLEEKIIFWMGLSFIIGGLFAGVLLIAKKASFKTKIAFGPFMIISFLLVYFFKDRIQWSLF